jgi:hypothetical protein
VHASQPTEIAGRKQRKVRNANPLHAVGAQAIAKSDPDAGKALNNVRMTVSRWPGMLGWVKIEQTVNGVKIYYVMNTITGAVNDYKFI